MSEFRVGLNPVRSDMMEKWPTVRFGNVLAEKLKNGIYKPKQYHGRGAKIVNMGELFAYPRIDDIPMKRVELSEREISASSLTPGDLLFARRSLVAEGAGRCSIVLSVGELTTFESSIIRARPDKTIADSEYLYYFFNSPQGKHHLGTILRQTAVSGITGSDLAELRIPLPPLSEQRVISHILGALDDKIELNRQMNQTLEQIAAALFKSWFVDLDPVRAKAEGRQPEGMDAETAALFPDRLVEAEIGEIPEGWCVQALPEIVEINPPRVLRRGDEAPYLDMANVPTSGPRAMNWFDRPFGSGSRFSNGDTLLARITPCLENGKTAFVDFLDHAQVGWGSTEFVVLHAKPPLPPVWAYLLAREPSFRSFAIQSMTGTSGRQRVQTDAFAKFQVAIPPDAIACRFGNIVNTLFDSIKANDEQSRTLAAIRDLLLPRLLSGEISIGSGYEQASKAYQEGSQAFSAQESQLTYFID